MEIALQQHGIGCAIDRDDDEIGFVERRGKRMHLRQIRIDEADKLLPRHRFTASIATDGRIGGRVVVATPRHHLAHDDAVIVRKHGAHQVASQDDFGLPQRGIRFRR